MSSKINGKRKLLQLVQSGAISAAEAAQLLASAPGAQPAPTKIAVVGLSACFPGAANAEAFWQNLAQGKDCVAFED